MTRYILLVLPLILNAAAIKVPVNPQEYSTEATSASSGSDETAPPSSHQHSSTDSYHVQPEQADFYKDTEGIVAPVRYLLPPKEDAEVYTHPSESQSEQEDWTPMIQNLPKAERGPQFNDDEETDKAKDSQELPQQQGLPEENIKQWFNPKLFADTDSESQPEENSDEPQKTELRIIVPSRHLLPPLFSIQPNANFEMPVPATDLMPPMFKPEPVFRPNLKKLKPIMPTISLEMQPPTPDQPKLYKNPTKLYPKKYSPYKPIPIPIDEYRGRDVQELPKARPVKFFKPVVHDIEDYIDSVENEKKLLKYQQAEEKRKFKEEEDAEKQQEFVDANVAKVFAQPEYTAPEQEASETGFNGQDSYAAEVAPQSPPVSDAGPADRTEFRMHGMHGPNSYKFGYDTGKGKNRQFRYEERSNDGHVKGHYGYVDGHGKTQVVNYDADPEHGFHAEGPFGKA